MAEIDVRNTTMNRSQETTPPPPKSGLMLGMKWIEPKVLSKVQETPFVAQIFGHQMAEIDARNTKWIGVKGVSP